MIVFDSVTGRIAMVSACEVLLAIPRVGEQLARKNHSVGSSVDVLTVLPNLCMHSDTQILSWRQYWDSQMSFNSSTEPLAGRPRQSRKA